MSNFAKELEVFRKEEETAQQLFFAWLSVRSLSASDTNVLKMMNEAPLYWINSQYAMLQGAFITLGRIFDQTSKHNIDRLIAAAAKDLTVFSLDALRVRKENLQITATQAAEYVKGRHALSANDVRLLRREIDFQRRIYVARYRDIETRYLLTRRPMTMS